MYPPAIADALTRRWIITGATGTEAASLIAADVLTGHDYADNFRRLLAYRAGVEAGRKQALADALEAVERGCADPDGARAVMELQ